MYNRKISIGAVILILIGIFISGIILAQDEMSEDDVDPGLVTVQSELTYDETIASAQEILEAEGFGIPLVLDHSANAARVDLDLPPTTLILFGNPMVGTSLMQESRSTAIDLPQKFLIWEDDDGSVFITYNDPSYLAQRHGIVEQDEKLEAISNRLQSLAEMIATTSPMMGDDEDSSEESDD